MAGYIRQSTFQDGDTITAALFNDEYNQLLAVFNNSTGHKHDGTTAEGPVIGLIGDAGLTTPLNKILIDTTNDHIEFWLDVSGTSTQQLYIADGAILPVTDNDIDLGSSSLEFKDLYIDGTANIDSLVADTADINGGTLDDVTIGATTAAAGTFTTVDTSGNVTVGGNLTVSGTTTTVNSNEVNIGDNILLLNSDETGTPSQNAGLEVERGTSTNVSLLWNETNDYWTFGSDHLNFPDNSKAYFGDSNDLEIYHDGSNSRIREVGTGSLLLDAESLYLRNTTGDSYLQGINGGAVNIFYNGLVKLNTTSSGIDVTGTTQTESLIVEKSFPTIFLNDTATTDKNYRIANGSSGTFSITETNDAGSYVANRFTISPTGNVGIATSSPDTKLEISDTQPTLRLTDTAAGSSGTAIGSLEFYSEDTSGNYPAVGAAIKAITESAFGSGHGLALFTNADATSPTERVRINQQGDVGIGTDSPEQLLHLASDNPNIRLEDTDGTDQYGQIKYNGTLFDIMSRNGASDGVIRFGGHGGGNFTEYARFASSGRLGIGTSSPSVDLHVNSTQPRIRTQDSEGDNTYLTIEALASGVSTLTARDGTSHGEFRFRTTTGTVTEDRMSIDSSGNVGIGTTSPSALLHVEGNALVTGNLTVNGNLTFGNAATDTVSFGADIDSHIIPDDDDTYDLGSSSQQWKDLYIDGVIYADQIDLGDNEKIRLGASQDLEIYHDGSHSYVKDNGTGNLTLAGTNLYLTTTNGQILFKGLTDAETALYYDNAEKLATTSSGIDVTGDVVADGLTIDAGGTWASSAGGLQLDYSSPEGFITTYYDSNSLTLGAGVTQKTGITINGHTTSDGSSIEFRTGNSETARFDSSGNFGIGTSSPTHGLTVVGSADSDASSYISINDPNNTALSRVLLGVGGDGDGQITLKEDGNTETVFINSEGNSYFNGGNVGIGTTSPSVPLHVYRTGNADLYLERASGARVFGQAQASAGVLGTNTNHRLDIKTNGTTRMTLDTSGNVGIGTGSPSTSLHINEGSPAIRLQDTDGTNQYTQISHISAATYFGARNDTADGTIIFGGYGGGSFTEYARFNSLGDLSTEGNITVGGNLTVSGTTTTIDTTNLNVEDKNITINYSTGDSSSTADGAGITIQDAVDASTDATILWDATNDRWEISHGLNFQDGDAILWSANSILQHTGSKTHIGDNSSASVLTLTGGNVGIGTTSPSNLLHLQGSSPIIRLTDTDTSAFSYINANSSAGSLFIEADAGQAAANSVIGFKIDNSEKVRIDTDGNVGIGTSSADAGLHIVKSSLAGQFIVSNTESDATTKYGAITGSHYTNAEEVMTGMLMTSYSSGNRVSIGGGITSSNAASEILFYTAANNTTLAGTEAMRIDSSGNLLVGTDNVGLITAATDKSIIIGSKTEGDRVALNLNVMEGTNNFRIENFLDDSSATYGFRSASSSSAPSFVIKQSSSEYLRVQAGTGNLGIGTTSPSAKLDVVGGTIRSTGDVGVAVDTGTNAYMVIDRSASDRRGALVFSTAATDVTASPPANATLDWALGVTDSDEVSGDKFYIHTDTNASNARFVIDGSTGNVGIGTTSPNGKLDVSTAQVTTNQFTSPHLRLRAASTTDNTGFTGVAYSSSTVDNYGWTVGALRATSGNNASFVFNVHNNSASGSEKMRIDGGTGRVGIGTSSPSANLHVNGNGADILNESSSAAAARYILKTANQEWRIGTHNGQNNNLWFYNVDNAAYRMSLTPAGNLGIGTTSPSQLLHLNASDARVRIQDADGTNQFHDLYAVGGSLYLQARNNTANGAILFRGHNGTSATEYARFDSSGNLGIGTTSPSSSLHVHSTNYTAATFERNQALANYGVSIDLKNSEDNIFNLACEGSEDFSIGYTPSGGSKTNLFTLNSSGNVGIGTTSIDEKLHVQGSVNNDDVAIKIENTYDDNLSTSRPAAALQFATASNNAHLRVFGAPADTAANHQIDLGSTAASSFITLSPAGSEAMRIDSSGNVGIGTDSPSANLHLKSTDAQKPIIQLESTAASGADTYIRYGDSSENYSYALGIDDTGNSFRLAYDGTSFDGAGVGANDLLTITSSGNVGIGDTSPLSKLHVVGAVLNNTTQDYGIAAFENSNSEGLSIGFDADDNFTYLYSREVGVGSRGLNLNGSIFVEYYGGNVGIGTDSPTVPLEVSGHVKVGDADGSTAAGDSQLNVKAISGEDAIVRVMAPSGNDSELRLGVLGTTGVNSLKFGDVLDSDVGYIQYDHSSNYLRFGTNANERARFDSSGNFLVGKTVTTNTTDGIELNNSGQLVASNTSVAAGVFNLNGTDGTMISFLKAGTPVGSISVTTSATAYNTSSDARLKDDIGDFKGLEIVEQLNPRKFAWKSDGKEDIGLYAQEVQELVPNAVSQNEDGYYQMDYSKLVTPLIKAIQEQQEQIESLKSEIKLLKGGN